MKIWTFIIVGVVCTGLVGIDAVSTDRALAEPTVGDRSPAISITATKGFSGSSQAPVGSFAQEGGLTFEERYHVRLILPMPEEQFLSIVEKLHLKYDGIGPVSANIKHRRVGWEETRPEPRVVHDYDMTNISYIYEIYGGYYEGLLEDHTENYLVLVNRQGMVVYMESQYDYGAWWLP